MSNTTEFPKIVFPLDFNFEKEMMVREVGLLERVHIELNEGKICEVSFISIDRLEKEMAQRSDNPIPYYTLPSLIVVSNLTKWIMDLSVRCLYTQEYFSSLMPLSSQSEYSQNVIKLKYRSGLSEFESESKGYLDDIAVGFCNELIAPMSLIIPIRIKQDLASEMYYGRPFFTEPGLVVVSEISYKNAEIIASELAKRKYFDHLKPISDHS